MTNAYIETPTSHPSLAPTAAPPDTPSSAPTLSPSNTPSSAPTLSPSNTPSSAPSLTPSSAPTLSPSDTPSSAPTLSPSNAPSSAPTACVDYESPFIHYNSNDGHDNKSAINMEPQIEASFYVDSNESVIYYNAIPTVE
eukprot:384803_1